MAVRLIARINIGIRREQSVSLLPDAVKSKLGWTPGKCLLRGTAAGTCGFTLEYVARTPLELHLRAEYSATRRPSCRDDANILFEFQSGS